MGGVIYNAVGPDLFSEASSYIYQFLPAATVGEAATRMAVNARALHRDINPAVKGSDSMWMRAPPGAHLLAWAFGEFVGLYGNGDQAEIAMRHSLACFMHTSTPVIWWPHSSVSAWRGRDTIKLMEITGHGTLSTRGPQMAMDAKYLEKYSDPELEQQTKDYVEGLAVMEQMVMAMIKQSGLEHTRVSYNEIVVPQSDQFHARDEGLNQG